MFRKFAFALIGGCLLVGAQIPEASASYGGVRCVAAAERINGHRVRGTRTVVERRREVRACRVALRHCEDKLQHARYVSGRPMPFARCNVVRVRHVDAYPPHASHHDPHHGSHGPSWHHGHSAPPPLDFKGGYCNVHACDLKYRSFRASDCTFQPYHGPRKHCAL